MGTITRASGWFMYLSRLNRSTTVNFEIVSTPGAVKCGFTSVNRQESRLWLVHRIPWTLIARYVLWNERQAPRFQRKSRIFFAIIWDTVECNPADINNVYAWSKNWQRKLLKYNPYIHKHGFVLFMFPLVFALFLCDLFDYFTHIRLC